MQCQTVPLLSSISCCKLLVSPSANVFPLTRWTILSPQKYCILYPYSFLPEGIASKPAPRQVAGHIFTWLFLGAAQSWLLTHGIPAPQNALIFPLPLISLLKTPTVTSAAYVRSKYGRCDSSVNFPVQSYACFTYLCGLINPDLEDQMPLNS